MPAYDQYIYQNNEPLKLVLEGLNAGIYELNLITRTSWCSSKFYHLLGYNRGEIEITLDPFLDELIIPSDRDLLTGLIRQQTKQEGPFVLETQLLTKSGQYRWFKITGQCKWENNEPAYLIGSLSDIEQRIQARIIDQRNEFLLEEVGLMAKVGGWELNLESMSVLWSKEVCLIHEVAPNYKPQLAEAINFYSPDYISIIQEAVNNALTKGTPFDLELKIITAKGKEVWVRAIGKSIYNQNQEIIGLRGVFQDIDEQKNKEIALHISQNLIQEQNKRLINFAHIVSHNLRSHATNMQLTLDLLEAEKEETEKIHLQEYLRKISVSLNETIRHLNDIVAIQTDIHSIKKTILFEDVFKGVLATLKPQIEQSQASITFDFEACKEIDYIPAYLESILLNLTSNAIKYRNPENKLEIKVHSFIKNGKPVLEVRDNGLGIDLDKYGASLFGMYKTFHNNPEARGIGLFITKNQVEALGGYITVTSIPKQGTTFTITF